MERTLRIINCPCCKSILYALKLDTRNDKEMWRLSQDSPMLRNDANGAFMMCSRCNKRIRLRMSDELESPGFELSSEQDCGQP